MEFTTNNNLCPMLRNVQTYNLGSASANGLIGSVTVKARDFRHANVCITASGGFAGTVKIYGSIQEPKPTLTSAASATNAYSPLQVINLDTAATTNGSTGLVFTGVGTDGTTTYEINVNLQQWVGIVVSNYSAGSVSAIITLADNH